MSRIHRNESNETGLRIWAAVDRAAAKAPERALEPGDRMNTKEQVVKSLVRDVCEGRASRASTVDEIMLMIQSGGETRLIDRLDKENHRLQVWLAVAWGVGALGWFVATILAAITIVR